MIADFVYHFMPLHRPGREKEDLAHVKSAVLDAEYFFRSPLDFNDPFDCKPNFRSSIKDGAHNMLHKQLKSNLARVGIFCVAEELYNTLMWSHYTYGHRGVALQFSTQQIRTAISDIGIMSKVKYQKALPEIDPCGVDKLKQMKGIIFRKSKRWSYEKEVRIVLPEVKSSIQTLVEMPVRNIYFGCKIDRDDESELIEAFRQRPSRIYRLEMSSTKFAYRRRPILCR